jgi:hypothetical protein
VQLFKKLYNNQEPPHLTHQHCFSNIYGKLSVDKKDSINNNLVECHNSTHQTHRLPIFLGNQKQNQPSWELSLENEDNEDDKEEQLEM